MAANLATEASFREIAHHVLQSCTAEHALVNLGDSESTTLRFANNQVVQHVSVREPSVSVRVAYGKKAGSASTNRLDRASLTDMVRRAEAIAKLAPEDPEYLPPLEPQIYLNIHSYRKNTAEATPLDLARTVKPVVDLCARRRLEGAGVMTAGSSASCVAASTGLFGYERSTEAEFSLTATAEDSSGWTLNAHRDINEMLVEWRTRNAVEKALLSRNPRELPPGHYPVILEPAAVAGVLGAISFALGAKSYFRGDSALSGKLGSAILDSRLTLKSDPAHPDLMGSAFGGDGLAARPQTWIEDGVLKQLSYDRFTAREHGVEPNPRPSALVLTFNGDTAGRLDDLIAGAERAILVTNFWYIRSVDPADLTITGMTRDGTFLVEDGKIVAGLRNFRFHESPLRCFAQVDAATAPMEAITLERGKMLLPAVRLPRFHFSSVTRF